MNGENQSLQEQHRLTERVARVETAIEYQGNAISELREEIRAGFARAEAQANQRFSRMDAEFDHVRTEMRQQSERVDARFDHLRDEMRQQSERADARSDHLRDEMRQQFERVDAEFVRVHAQITKSRTTDFRILLSIGLTTALGMIGLIIKVLGLI